MSEPTDKQFPFTLLTGRCPFPAAGFFEVMFAHCTLPVPDPRSQVPGLPERCAVIASRAMAFIRNVSLLGLTLAGVDYGLQRRRTSKSMMMSKQELKDESRMSEGDPKVKGRIRPAAPPAARPSRRARRSSSASR